MAPCGSSARSSTRPPGSHCPRETEGRWSMATIDPRAVIRKAAVPALLALVVTGCARPAQIGTDEEAHKTVDALFTALTAQDAARLEQCEKRLQELSAA